MADTRASRVKKAQTVEKRQYEREMVEELRRQDEAEPPREDESPGQ
ncbi:MULTISPECIES: hypothetical protein [Salinibaculum]